jgi:hypothetical protein
MEASGQLHAPAGLPQVKSSWYPLDRRLGRPQNHSGRGGEDKNSQPLPRLESPIILSVTQRYTTKLCWLLSSTVAEDFVSTACVERIDCVEFPHVPLDIQYHTIFHILEVPCSNFDHESSYAR